MENAVIQRVALETDLRHAIDQRQFVIHLQAQVATPAAWSPAPKRWYAGNTDARSWCREFIPLAEGAGRSAPRSPGSQFTDCLPRCRAATPRWRR